MSKKKKKHPVLRRTSIAMGVALMFSAGSAMAQVSTPEGIVMGETTMAVVGNTMLLHAHPDDSSLPVLTMRGNSVLTSSDKLLFFFGAGTIAMSSGPLISADYARSEGDGTATATDSSLFMNVRRVIPYEQSTGSIRGGHAHVMGNGTATANNNSISINDPSVTVDADRILIGIAVDMEGGRTGIPSPIDTNNNLVMMHSNLSGGFAQVDGSGNATASLNEVTIHAGPTLTGRVVGGTALSNSGAAVASGNTVNFSGEALTGDIIGGFVRSNTGMVTATNNTVNINRGTISQGVSGGHKEGTAPGDVFTGNTLNLNTNVALTSVRNFETINLGFSGNARIAILDTTPTGAATTTGVTLNTQSNNINFIGQITGSGSFTKVGTGTLTVDDVNVAAVAVNAGALDIDHGGRLTASDTITVGGGTLNINSGARAVTDIANINSGALNIDNGGRLEARTARVDDNAVVNIAGGGRLETTGNTLYVAGGAVNVNRDGVVESRIAVSAGALNINEGGSVSSGAVGVTGGSLNIAGGGELVTGGAVSVSSGAVNIHGGRLIATGQNVAVGSGALNITQGGQLHAEALNVASGATLGLEVGSVQAPVTANSVTLVNGAILNLTGVTETATNRQLFNAPDQNIAAGVVLQFEGAALDAGNNSSQFMNVSLTDDLRLTTHLVWNDPSDNHGTFNIPESGFTITERIADNPNPTHPWSGNVLTKEGPGTLVLAGNNAYTGGTLLNAGRINVGSNTALGSGELTMRAGTTLGFTEGNWTVGNNIEMAGAGNFTFVTDSNATLGGVVSGEGALIKSGSGILTLAGANTYTGATTVNAGTLVVTGSLGAGNYSRNIVNNGELVFRQNSNQTLAGVISGSGSLKKEGAGRLVLSSANTYSGNTEITAGTLELTGSGNIASDRIILNGGTRFIPGVASLRNLRNIDVHGSSTWTGNLDASGKNLSFFVPGSLASNRTMLAVEGTATLDQGTTVHAGLHGRVSMRPGDTINLVSATEQLLDTGSNLHGTQALLTAGATVDYAIDLAVDTQNNRLTGRIEGGGANDAAKTLSQGYLGGMGVLNSGSDLATSIGIAKARAVSGTGSSGTGSFGAIGGSSLRNKTGSHVDTNGISLVAGIAHGQTVELGRLTLGGFIEYGTASYDTYNAFSRGNGDAWHFGAGVLGRLDFASNVYAEGSARAGVLKNDFTGADTAYDASSAYYSLHVGGGYILDISEKNSLDLYGKFFWTHLGSESLTLQTGESVRFDSVNSTRLRAGTRLNFATTTSVSPYVGLAYEYEFDGKAKATTNGFDISAPSLKGGSGIAEMGLSVQPSPSRPLFVDIGLQGYAGKREGVTGNIQLRYRF